jgi:DnaJ-class molecular chaperone
MNFHERKKLRTEHYHRFVKGWKKSKCVACNGSGRYDSFNSPRCGCCGGTGFTTSRDVDGGHSLASQTH